MKIIVVAILLVLTVMAGTAGYILGTANVKPVPEEHSTAPYKLMPEVQTILGKKLELLKELQQNKVILAEVARSNRQNKALTQGLINQRDQNWRKSGPTDEAVRPYLTDGTAQELIKFQQKYSFLTEIIVTDQRGLNVGMTNMTSDYYQADEAWWIKGYNDGKGLAYYGDIEFDESSQTEAIALYAPLYDPVSRTTVGVIKALVNLNTIKLEI